MSIQIGRSPRLKAAYLEYAEADAAAKDAAARKAAAKKILDEARGDERDFTLAGATVLTIAVKTRRTTDTALLKANHPDIARKVERVTKYDEWTLTKK